MSVVYHLLTVRNRPMTRRVSPAALLALVCLFVAGLPAYAAMDTLRQVQQAIADVADKVQPSVVSITAERPEDAGRTPTFRLPRPGPPGAPEGQPEGPFSQARGSGLLFRETPEYYYILTNAHVVREARDNQVEVLIPGERESRTGTVLGDARFIDAAVVRIDRRPEDQLKMLPFGRVANQRVGDFVIAIGSPFNFQGSVSFGIISSLDREIVEPEPERPDQPEVYRGLIQTDAAINPGNSGGPLVNIDGEVIGINFMIFSPSASPLGPSGSVGIGFAIPIDRVVPWLDQLIETGRVERGFLGVQVQNLEFVAEEQEVNLARIRELFGTDSGAFVREVTPGMPAVQAGIQPGDVIVAINGQAVADTGDLIDMISLARPGTDVQLELLRGRQPLTVTATVAARPGAAERAVEPDRGLPQPAMQDDPLGLSVAPLTAEQAGEYGLDPNAGVMVVNVQPNSPAGRVGLQAGQVLLAGRRPSEDNSINVEFNSVQAYMAFVNQLQQEELVVLTAVVPTEAGPIRRAFILAVTPMGGVGQRQR